MVKRLISWLDRRYGSLLGHYPDTRWKLTNGDGAYITDGRWLGIIQYEHKGRYGETTKQMFYFQEVPTLRGRQFAWHGHLLRDNGHCIGVDALPEEIKDILLPLLSSLPQIVKKSIDTRVEAQTVAEQKRRDTLEQYIEMLKEG